MQFLGGVGEGKGIDAVLFLHHEDHRHVYGNAAVGACFPEDHRRDPQGLLPNHVEILGGNRDLYIGMEAVGSGFLRVLFRQHDIAVCTVLGSFSVAEPELKEAVTGGEGTVGQIDLVVVIIAVVPVIAGLTEGFVHIDLSAVGEVVATEILCMDPTGINVVFGRRKAVHLFQKNTVYQNVIGAIKGLSLGNGAFPKLTIVHIGIDPVVPCGESDIRAYADDLVIKEEVGLLGT